MLALASTKNAATKRDTWCKLQNSMRVRPFSTSMASTQSLSTTMVKKYSNPGCYGLHPPTCQVKNNTQALPPPTCPDPAGSAPYRAVARNPGATTLGGGSSPPVSS
eukprot:711136-Pelagomonas_calceolata.AAC.7